MMDVLESTLTRHQIFNQENHMHESLNDIVEKATKERLGLASGNVKDRYCHRAFLLAEENRGYFKGSFDGR